jgi:hypothetical protein
MNGLDRATVNKVSGRPVENPGDFYFDSTTNRMVVMVCKRSGSARIEVEHPASGERRNPRGMWLERHPFYAAFELSDATWILIGGIRLSCRPQGSTGRGLT